MQVVRESDGVGLTGGQDVYIWGVSDRLLPSGEPVYLVETLGASTTFDISGEPSTQLSVLALLNGLFTPRGTLPVAGRPAIVAEPPAGTRGAGSFTSYAELSLRDIDGDGLLDVELADGSWVGYSILAGDFEVKPR